ncbi:MAG: hypothetical protein KDB22_09635 [Planctomycetales bacterium]|nr:hypothetical protein [Planctomycetales bacterium]
MISRSVGNLGISRRTPPLGKRNYPSRRKSHCFHATRGSEGRSPSDAKGNLPNLADPLRVPARDFPKAKELVSLDAISQMCPMCRESSVSKLQLSVAIKHCVHAKPATNVLWGNERFRDLPGRVLS